MQRASNCQHRMCHSFEHYLAIIGVIKGMSLRLWRLVRLTWKLLPNACILPKSYLFDQACCVKETPLCELEASNSCCALVSGRFLAVFYVCVRGMPHLEVFLLKYKCSKAENILKWHVEFNLNYFESWGCIEFILTPLRKCKTFELHALQCATVKPLAHHISQR